MVVATNLIHLFTQCLASYFASGQLNVIYDTKVVIYMFLQYLLVGIWCFVTVILGGGKATLYLLRMVDFARVQHIKIKGRATPYDPT